MTDAQSKVDPSSIDRRRLLTALATLPAVGWANRALSAPGPLDAATVLVAGPDGGSLDRWNKVVQPSLAQGLPPQTVVRSSRVGAADGVTGANQFVARGDPDGLTVLLVPGDAAMAWLVGDPRAQYDVGRWLSVLTALTPGIVIARPQAVAAGRDVRLSASGPGGIELPAIMGIDLLGARTILAPRLAPEALVPAFARGEIDAVFLRGHNVSEHAAAVIGAGGIPVFSLGSRDSAGQPVRCATFPDTPTLREAHAQLRGPMTSSPLTDGWAAAAIASQMEFALVLPRLTSASSIAVWRHAGAEAAASLDVQSLAMALGVRAIGGQDATTTANAAAADQFAMVELRRWLATRFNWRPA